MVSVDVKHHVYWFSFRWNEQQFDWTWTAQYRCSGGSSQLLQHTESFLSMNNIEMSLSTAHIITTQYEIYTYTVVKQSFLLYEAVEHASFQWRMWPRTNNNYEFFRSYRSFPVIHNAIIEQLWRTVLTYTTTHKEQLNTSDFDRQSSSGVRSEIENNKRRRK